MSPIGNGAIAEIARVGRPGGLVPFEEVTRHVLDTWVFRAVIDAGAAAFPAWRCAVAWNLFAHTGNANDVDVRIPCRWASPAGPRGTLDTLVAPGTTSPPGDFTAVAALLTAGRPSDVELTDMTKSNIRAAFASYAATHEPASIRRCWSTWNVLFDFLNCADDHVL